MMNDDELRKELWKMIIRRLRDVGLLGSQDYFQKVSDNPYTTIKSLEAPTLQPKAPRDGMSHSPIFKDSSSQYMAEDCFDKPFRLLQIWRAYYVCQHSSFPPHFDSF